MNYIITRSDGSEALYHHGIKGQKWGVRKYQNEDGSLTEEGIRRYGDKYGKKIKKKHGEEVQRLAEKYAKSDKRRKDIRAIDKQRKDYMKKFDMTQDDKNDPMSVSWRTKRGYSDENIVNGYLNILDKQEKIETSIYKDAGSKAYNDLYKKYYSKGRKKYNNKH